MIKNINIKTGELVIEKGEVNIKTGSIGSCVVITMYDKISKVGGLAHAMLPTRREGVSPTIVDVDFSSGNISAKYTDEAVDNLLYEIKKNGGNIENMEAKLVGGASMFRRLGGDKNGIGFQNIESAKNKLKKYNIYVENEDTGGSSGKTVIFSLQTGLVEVITTL